MEATDDKLQPLCDNCSEQLCEPYIECVECTNLNLCTNCFSQGRECKKHKNFHNYAIRKNNFPLFENCNWSAKEEYKLLEAMSIHGYGNWEEISKFTQTRSRLECREHYKKYYVENTQLKEIQIIPPTIQSVFPRPIIPFLYNKENIEEPPRPQSGNNQHMAGYNAFRSDFELHYDHNAETLMSIDYIDMDESDSNLVDSLRCALFNSYNNRLRERQRRYRIMQAHGLIQSRKIARWLQRFDDTLGRSNVERLFSVMQLMSGMQFDAFVETIHMETEISMNLMRLHDFRKNGIKSIRGARLYRHLKAQNEINGKEQRMFTRVLDFNMKQCEVQMKEGNFQLGDIMSKDVNIKLNGNKRVSLPLEILDLPGYEKLCDSERDLCSNLRIMPANFMEIKEQLISENNKLGGLRLLDARRIIKIDVNKTRKIYDHLIKEGLVKKPH